MAVLTSWNFGTGSEGIFLPDSPGTSKGSPKLKFNFTMQVRFRQGSPPDEGSDVMAEMAIPLKSATRPNINVNYHEYSKYGFRSRTQTKIEYGTITVMLYDDVPNKSHDMLVTYLNEMSPISNIPREQASLLETSNPTSVGVMDKTAGIIEWLRITHHYMVQGEKKKTHYDYLNPKIQNIVMDDLDMTSSDASTVGFTFLYDSVNMVNE